MRYHGAVQLGMTITANIPQEAIEAAAKASWGGNWDEADDQWKAVYRQEARIHLEAAAPYLLAAATYTHEESYAEGWDAAKSYYDGDAS